MANLNNEHLEIICKLQYKDLKLANMGKADMLKAQDLMKAGLAVETPINENEILSVRYLHLTERGQMILEQLEFELNRALMV